MGPCADPASKYLSHTDDVNSWIHNRAKALTLQEQKLLLQRLIREQQPVTRAKMMLARS
jgi:beta-lactamase class D